jgi:hypothetical protein
MPILDEVRRALSRTGLSSDYIIIMNPADYAALASVMVEPQYAMATYMGARVVQDAAHPAGFVTIHNQASGTTVWPPPSPDADRTWPIVNVPRLVGNVTVPGVVSTVSVVLNVHAEPPEPKPRSLWERLAEDDE